MLSPSILQKAILVSSSIQIPCNKRNVVSAGTLLCAVSDSWREFPPQASNRATHIQRQAAFILCILITDSGYIYAPFVAIGCYYLFYYLNITKKINIRNRRLEHQALFFFEILTLTLESGRNLENALIVTCDNVDSEISQLFKGALYDMKFGKSLIEALSDLRENISSDIISNIILNIIQTNRFGNSILETLYNEVDFLRQKELMTTKEQINKIPNKVSIISVLFIVPLILVLILGPYLIEFIS